MNFFEIVLGIFVLIIFMPFFNEVVENANKEKQKKEDEKTLARIIRENTRR